MVLDFHPPILNSAGPWATTLEELQALYGSPYIGAITIRTSLIDGFVHDENIHKYAFFSPLEAALAHSSTSRTSSINTLGYSPIRLGIYLEYIPKLVPPPDNPKKPIVISVTGSSTAIPIIHSTIKTFMDSHTNSGPLLVELNLSCPNIPNSPPPAYSSIALSAYLSAIPLDADLSWGIKLPPYTHAGEFQDLVTTLLAYNPCPIKFITSTNTLGNCLVLPLSESVSDDGDIGVGGMAGLSIHPLSLGNVHKLRGVLDQHESLKQIEIIGVGGVRNAEGYRRMRSVGAKVVAIGTAMGSEGMSVFERVATEVERGKGW